MGNWQGFYKIVQPVQTGKLVHDSQDTSGGSSSYAAYSWYNRLIQGSTTRQTRYREYDLMDDDVDINIALDMISEEMVTNFEQSGLPVKIHIKESCTTLSNEDIQTLKICLEHWSDIHQWETRLFPISRNTIKYGDCFFRRQSKRNYKWNHIHPRHILAAIVDKDDVTKVIGWQIRYDTKKPKNSPFYQPANVSGDNNNSEIVSADEIIRFTLNDDMSDMAPFGESVLRHAYRAQKQKSLLEDAIIIYRVSRAPERRVFYIDTGKLPPHRSKQYLEQIKNEIKQKKIPSKEKGNNTMDTVYNPHSMQEDFFFAQRADGKGSRVETLAGGQNLGELSDLEYFEDRVSRSLRIPMSYGGRKQNQNSIFNDGQVGRAYIEELRFSKYVERLQRNLECVMDYEFKKYLRESNIRIDETGYKIKLHPPTNFGKYRQQQLDNEIINTANSAAGMASLSKRFVLERYLQLSKDEIAENEQMLIQELGLDPQDPNIYAKLYNEGGEMEFGDAMGAPMSSSDIGDDFSEPMSDTTTDTTTDT